MAMDIDAVASDFEELDSEEPAPKKTAAKKKAAAPAKKKAPAKGRGKKAAVLVKFLSLIISHIHHLIIIPSD
jgi:double-strand break repair protein MRE11